MGTLKIVMTVQAVVLVIYALPMLLVPRYWTELTRQAPLPENYILRAVGIAFLILSYLELNIVGDLERYQGLILAYAFLPALFCLTIIVQVLKRRFDGSPAFYGASWYWWLNGVVTAAFAIAVFVASRRL
jgi:uncharacterized protein YjeT (DUF2065 family)